MDRLNDRGHYPYPLSKAKEGNETKYALLDEADLGLTEKYTLEPRVEVDRNGGRARILVWTFDRQHGRGSGKYLHELLWSAHKGGIAHGHAVVHKNGITMDNRLDNLVLVNTNNALTRTTTGQKETDYWEIIRQIRLDPIQEFMSCSATSGNRFYSADGDSFRVEDGSTVFYECHNPPCCNIERIVRQFNMCGRCRLVRYCSSECQELDWAFHRMFCQQQTSLEEEMIDR